LGPVDHNLPTLAPFFADASTGESGLCLQMLKRLTISARKLLD
jgi:hypothetical protein